MVVFTCNHCGDSLQKPKVAKHYQFQCRKYPDLTCVDCHKDFRGEEFVEHTQCITENQKYGGQNYVQKPSANKGERKQNEWINVVQNVLTNDATLTEPERRFLQQIVRNTNIPRKKQKFFNFIKSSCGNRVNWDVVETVWVKMENSLKQTKEVNENVNEKEEKPTGTENGGTENDNNENTVTDNHENSANGATEKKKKSKKKKTEEMGDEKSVVRSDDTAVKDSETKVEKKKSKKRKIENGNGEKSKVDFLAAADIDASLNNAENSTAENQNNENLLRENGNEESERNEGNEKKKKSKKRKMTAETKKSDEDIKDESSAQDDGQETSEKMLKKRKIESTEDKPEEKMETDELQITTIKNAKNNASNFDWKQVIKEIMTQKSVDGRLSVKKLQKKVVSRYLKSRHEITKEDAISKFDKILRKMKNYNIQNEIVHIVKS